MKRSVGLIAAIVVLASALSGCSAGDAPKFIAGSKLTIGLQAPVQNLNSGVATNLASISSAKEIAYLTMPSFYSPDSAGVLQPNTDFGSVKLVGSNKVKYSLTGKARWTDGQPVTGRDLNLSVLAATSRYDPVSQSGFNSYLRFTSLAGARASAVNETGLTLTYKHLPADWQTNLPVTIAAHLVSARAGEEQTPDAETETNYSKNTALLLNGVPNVTSANKLATAGAYKIVKASSKQILLVHNPEFTWGPAATIDKLTVKAFSDAAGLLQAIKSKQVDLASPVESTSANRAQIKDATAASGGNLTEGIGPFNESILLNHGLGSAFNSASYNGDAKKTELLSSAFLNLIPRAGIYSTLLSTSAMNKTDSFAFAFGTSDYAASIQQNGTANHQFQNAELAQEKWQRAGFSRTIKIRVLFDSENPRGQLEYTQLAQWGKISGFTIQNVAGDDVYQVLQSGAWDVYLATLPRLSADAGSISELTGSLNGLGVAAVTDLASKLGRNPESPTKSATLSALDKKLIANYVGLPVFELPSMLFTSKRCAGFKPSLNQQFTTWGYPYWSVSAVAK